VHCLYIDNDDVNCILFLVIYYNSVMARKGTVSKKNTTRRTRMSAKRRAHDSRRQKKVLRGKRSRKTRRTRRRVKRSRRGGSMDALLAFDPSKSTPMLPNPHIAYTGKGGGNAQTATVSPFVGKPWGAEIEELPGVSGSHSGNHYSANTYAVQPEMNTTSERNTPVIQGGKGRRKTKKYRMKGGMFQVWSQLKNDVVNGMREFQGKTPDPSPLPYKDQVFNGDNQEDNLGYLRVKNTYY
jgi:hypothetical protein